MSQADHLEQQAQAAAARQQLAQALLLTKEQVVMVETVLLHQSLEHQLLMLAAVAVAIELEVT
jgi:hypothetical protein